MLSGILKWMAIFLISLSIVPLLHFANTFVLVNKTHYVVGQLEQQKEMQSLSALIDQWIAAENSTEQLSISVIKKELDLYHQATSNPLKSELKNLLVKTEDYAYFINTEMRHAPANTYGTESYNLIKERQQRLAEELKASTDNMLTIGLNRTQGQLSDVLLFEKIIGILSTASFIAPIIIFSIMYKRWLLPTLHKFNFLENLYHNSEVGSLAVNMQGVVTFTNSSAELLLGLNSLQSGDSLNEATVSISGDKLVKPLYEVLHNQKPLYNHRITIGKKTDKHKVSVSYYPLSFNDTLIGAYLQIRPLESQVDRKILFAEVEEERKRISIEIHDWIGRNFSSIIHAIDLFLRKKSNNLPEDWKTELSHIRYSCQCAASDMRRIMQDIHPYLIEKVGFMEALESFVKDLEQRHGLKVLLYYHQKRLNLERDEKLVVYRIVQEALTNVIKHSSASEVDIFFKCNEDTLRIEIFDNGKPLQELQEGKGLWGMKQRANAIGGDLEFQQGQFGFSVILTVPLAVEGREDDDQN